MPDATQESTEVVDPSGPVASLDVELTSDTKTISAKLPEKYAADLVPLAALATMLFGVPSTLLAANSLNMPWQAALPLAIGEIIAAVTIALKRASPVRSDRRPK